MSIQTQARAVAERCADAYSFDIYRSWTGVAAMLLKRGYTEREAEAIMRSKWTRWAGDMVSRSSGLPASTLADFIDGQITHRGTAKVAADVRELVAGTFGEV